VFDVRAGFSILLSLGAICVFLPPASCLHDNPHFCPWSKGLLFVWQGCHWSVRLLIQAAVIKLQLQKGKQ